MAKAAAFWQVANYREAYGLFACSGLLFNHESPLRPERFVTQKIVRTATRIAEGSDEMLRLGRLDVSRDWGWAPEYVEAMWRMLQMDCPEDVVIATGRTHSLIDFVRLAFECVGLEWQAHVRFETALVRPADLLLSRADPSKAGRLLGWRAEKQLPEIVATMVEHARARI